MSKASTSIEYTVTDSHLGTLLVAQTQLGICAVLFAESAAGLKEALRKIFKNNILIENNDAL